MPDPIVGAGMIEWTGDGVSIESSVQTEVPENARAILPVETAVLNGALSLIGASTITAIDDDSQNANYCKIFYPPLLDAALTMTHWKSAGAQAILQVDQTAPLFGYTYRYTLPSDYLKLRQYNGGDVNNNGLVLWWGQWMQRYVLQGKSMLSQESPVAITYTRRITDPNFWSPGFYQMVMHLLANKLAHAIPKDSKKAGDMMTEAMTVWYPMALAADGPDDIVSLRSDALLRGRNRA